MADDDSYTAFLHRANNPPSVPSSSTATSTSLDVAPSKSHPFIPLLNNKLANLTSKTFTTETDSDFRAVFIPSSSLPSWSDSHCFPDAKDLEKQVDGGREAEELSVKQWDEEGEYSAVIKAVKDITKRRDVAIYTVKGRGGRYEVFILAKVDDGLAGVRAMGVAT